jgi:amino acid transporter
VIIAPGNIGYLLAHILALSGFVLLRRDRPAAERPIRLHRAFVPLAAGLVLVLAVVLVIGAASFDLTGYGDLRELVVALIVLSMSVVLFAVRRVLQDGGRLRVRAPSEPSVTVTTRATAPR